MANEILTSALPRSADVRALQYELSLADRAFLNSQLYPQIIKVDATKRGSNVIRLSEYGLGVDAMTAAGTELDDVANTALGQDSATVSVGRHSLNRDVSSLALATDDQIMSALLWQDILMSSSRARTNKLAALADSFPTQVGTTGVEMALLTHLTAISTLEGLNVDGPYLAVYHSNQRRGLRVEQLLTSAGQTQYIPPAQGTGVGTGYAGELFNVGMFISNAIPLSTADRKGMMIGRGAILEANLTPVVEDPARQAVIGNVLVEWAREAGKAKSEYHGHDFFGDVIFDTDRGVEIISKN